MKAPYCVWRYIALVFWMLVMANVFREIGDEETALFISLCASVFCALVLLRHVIFLLYQND